MIKDFKKFILRGNLVDLTIGFTVGAAFSTVAKSLVNDIIMPPIGFVLGGAEFSNLMWVLKSGDPPAPYTSVADAQAAGAVTINYGQFINNILSLILVGLAMFIVIKAFTHLEEGFLPVTKKDKKNKDPVNKKCPYCLSTIAFKATRCPNCTSRLK